MPKQPSEATQLKTLKRENRRLNEENTRMFLIQSRYIKAKEEVEEWKERFDILLRREEDK